MTKPTKWYVRPAKTQISLGICPVWSESSLSAWRNLGPLATYWAHSEDSDQTGRMPRLIWVFAGRTVILLVLSWCSSFVVQVIGPHLLTFIGRNTDRTIIVDDSTSKVVKTVWFKELTPISRPWGPQTWVTPNTCRGLNKGILRVSPVCLQSTLQLRNKTLIMSETMGVRLLLHFLLRLCSLFPRNACMENVLKLSFN